FAREQRFAHKGRAEFRRVRVVLEIGRQQIRMARKHLPEQGENALVGKDRLPWRLDPSRRRFRKLRAKGVVKHPFPGVELEREFDSAIVEIDEAAVFGKTDILDVD